MDEFTLFSDLAPQPHLHKLFYMMWGIAAFSQLTIVATSLAFSSKAFKATDRLKSFANHLTKILVHFLWFIFATCVFIAAQWSVLGLFVNPQKTAPFASAITGIIAHIVFLRRSFYRRYDIIVDKFKEAVAARMNQVALDKVVSRDQAKASRDQAKAGAGNPGAAEFVRSFAKDVKQSDVEAVMEELGLTVNALVWMTITSTIVIVFWLFFLLIGLGAFADRQDSLTSVIGSTLSFLTVIATSLGAGSTDSPDELSVIVHKLVEYHHDRKENTLTQFDISEGVITSSHKAAIHFDRDGDGMTDEESDKESNQ